MARYIQKLSFGIETVEWWVGWEIDNFSKPVTGLIPADAMSEEDLERLGVASFQKVTLDLLSRIERRTVHRVRLPEPFRGMTGTVEVKVIDLSAGGAGIAHERPIRPGTIIELHFTDGNQTYALYFEVLRCQLSRGFLDEGLARYYSALKLRPREVEDKRTLERLVTRIISEQSSAIRQNPSETLALM